MAIETLEHRLETVEMRLETLQRLFEERLESSKAPQEEKRGWRAIVGTFENDSLYDEAMQKGREWRESRESQHEAMN
jgi:hypothetical protein